MSQINYSAMSYRELRRYFLDHRDDRAAFQAYLAKRRERSPESLQQLTIQTLMSKFRQQFASKWHSIRSSAVQRHNTALQRINESRT